ncbi:hypothetical protein [Flavobacterium sp.]|uniref:hypothetical protein n=1 Tax=Flavobacterium sp. TaxID=239 RepID=UPI003751A139
MNKFHILVIVILGFFLMPAVTYACGCNSEKNSCNKETSANSEKMDCCNNHNHSKNKNNEGCNGKCGHSNCVTASFRSSIAFFEINFKNSNFEFLEKNQNYFNSKTNISSGFYSIWLIPKIS